jgi:hypothetical protein
MVFILQIKMILQLHIPRMMEKTTTGHKKL